LLSRFQRAPNAAVLLIICASYLMIILDVSIVITALPKIHTALGFSSTNLSWVQNAYTLTFGGLMLLGARAGDLLGRRRTFMFGIALFTGASMLAGLAQSPAWLLGARAVQGIGAAIAAPASLSLLMVSFREGRERVRALAWYSAVAAGGGSVGLVLGGLLTDLVSWRWGLFLNVPIGAALIWAAPRYLPETERRDGRFDLAGAATATLGMSALVYGFVRAAEDGWGDRVTIASFALSVVLLVGFVFNETRAEQPITPLRLFSSRERSGAYVARILVVSGMFAMFFFLTQFMQGARLYSPLAAGLAFLPMTIVMFSMIRVVPRIAERVGNSRLLIGGLALDFVGMAWLSRLGIGTPYFPGIAVPLVLMGVGMGLALTPLTAAGIAGVKPDDAGAASGLVNTAHQLGGSLGLSVLVTVFASASRSVADQPPAGVSHGGLARLELAHGVASSLTGSAILIALALLVSVFAVRRPPAPAPVLAQAEAAG
jgi:EmrB/QacA subfamily drug resistance transporter